LQREKECSLQQLFEARVESQRGQIRKGGDVLQHGVDHVLAIIGYVTILVLQPQEKYSEKESM
jgi:hypothetical protein